MSYDLVTDGPKPVCRVEEVVHLALREVDAADAAVALGDADESFGAGAGERVGLGCRTASGEGAVVVEVRLSLPPVVALRDSGGTVWLGELLGDAPPMPAQCRHGSVP